LLCSARDGEVRGEELRVGAEGRESFDLATGHPLQSTMIAGSSSVRQTIVRMVIRLFPNLVGARTSDYDVRSIPTAAAVMTAKQVQPR
jgi:hypothetical protein